MGYGTKISSIKNESKNIFLSLELDKKYVIRILPSLDGESTFFEAWIHYKLGEPFLCPKRHFNKPCFACEFAQKIYSDKQLPEESKKAVSFMFPKKRYFMNVFVRSPEMEDNIRVWGISKTAFSTITGYMLSEEYGDVTDTDNGFDFNVVMTKAAGQQFPHLELMPKRLSSPLAQTEKETEEIMKKIHDLKSIISTLSYEDIKARVKDSMSTSLANEEEDAQLETPALAEGAKNIVTSKDEDDEIPF